MEAKDTVMKEDGKRGCVFTDKGGYRTPWSITDHTAKAQAELSFKAGIREVVDWIQQTHQYIGFCHPDAFANWIQIEMGIWQAKLKEWGINP